jgi:CheY-like chemotaxis protein
MTFVEHGESLAGRRILVVDDDEDVREFLTAVLEDAGAEVLAVGDGAAALDAARLLKPDLITLDLSMPGRDGGQVLADLRGDDAVCDIPVCIITGRPELRRLIYERPVRPPEGFETKPIDPVRLIADLRRILHLADRKRQREVAHGG